MDCGCSHDSLQAIKDTTLTAPSLREPSELERVASGDVASSNALFGSQIFCRGVRVTHSQNHATAMLLGLFGKTEK